MHCFRTQVSPVFYNNIYNQKNQPIKATKKPPFFNFKYSQFYPLPANLCRLCSLATWRMISAPTATLNNHERKRIYSAGKIHGLLHRVLGFVKSSMALNAAHNLGNKLGLPALALGAMVMPTKSLTNVPIGTLDVVMMSDTFVVATLPGVSTLYQSEGYQHGFGYDVTRRYASHLGAHLVLKTYENESEALHALHTGKVDAYLSADAVQRTTQTLDFAILSCENSLVERGLSNGVRLNFRSGGRFSDNAKSYLCDTSTQSHTLNVARFYDTGVLDSYSKEHLAAALNTKLPRYEAQFKKAADKYAHDWHLLAAISYQESQFNPNAVSPTGVRGIMMLTTDTANAMGIDDRTNVAQSIEGGAKYLAELNTMFADVPQSDRLWFVLAGYNMGPNAIKRIQQTLTNNNQDPNQWSNVYHHLSNNAHKNSRYGQCLHYVTHIRSYLEIIKDSDGLSKNT